jgi:hypothetical protein
MARSTTMKAKLVPKDLGNPKRVTTLPEGQNKVVLGTIIGIASDIFTRTDPQQNTYEGLKGSFEGVSSDDTQDIIQSGVLYLPTGMHEMIADVIKQVDDKGERTVASVQFAFEVAAVKASNPQGYSWAIKKLVDETEADPLKELRSIALGNPAKPLQIEKGDKKAK